MKLLDPITIFDHNKGVGVSIDIVRDRNKKYRLIIDDLQGGDVQLPIKEVKRRGKDGVTRVIGYKWGSGGKVYLIRRWGKNKAYNLARKQGIAIKVSQNRR